MIYPDHFEQKIGFDKVRQLLLDRCQSTLGTERVEEMAFSVNVDWVRKELFMTTEMVNILCGEVEFPAHYFCDLRSVLKRLRVEGTYLDQTNLFDLCRSLDSILQIVSFFKVEEDQDPAYPLLYQEAAQTQVFPHLIKQIDHIIDKYGDIKDNASAELARIRRELHQTMSSISKTLSSIVRSAQQEGFVEKDTAPTMRDGRLVIPVIPAYKRRIQGIVHDESASGKTLFIEPQQVVEANNRIRELEGEERREVIRILTQFSDILRPNLEDITMSYEFLGLIEFLRAKAQLAQTFSAVTPIIYEEPLISWQNAVHPLLLLSLQKQHKTVVPLDIELNSEQRILLISGPNAGGKSVCLKTVGLLQYMMQCGLLIPVQENSKAGIFHSLFIDIGDEQSIENDLSTYSSHLTHMKHFVRNVDARSLLLIDEFGSGTEPQIGGAIAQALLGEFNRKNTLGVITTHYQNLKHFARQSQGIVNSAMLYDRHRMLPLFRLEIGHPGSSFAIEIARNIGLPESLIADASAQVGSNYIDMDKYLQEITRDKRYWEGKRQTIRQQEKRLDELTKRYETDLKEIESERKGLIKKATQEAEQLILSANARIEATIREIKLAQAEKEKTKVARQALSLHKEQLSEVEKGDGDDKIARQIQKIARRQTKSNEEKNEKKDTPQQRPPVAGDAVRLKGQNVVGELVQLQGKKAVVAFGAIKSTIALDLLERVSASMLNKGIKKNTYISQETGENIREKNLKFKSEIDVRGMRADEALQAVTYFIDDAIQVGAGRIRILHGTGTGALRQIIRQYLNSVSGVAHYADEHIQLGGTGITVIDLE